MVKHRDVCIALCDLVETFNLLPWGWVGEEEQVERDNKSARLISHGIVFFSRNKSASAGLSAVETINRTALPWWIPQQRGHRQAFVAR